MAGGQVGGWKASDHLSRPQGNGEGVYLDQVTRVVDLVSSGLPSGVGPPCPSPQLAPPGLDQEGGYAQNAAVGFQVGQDAAYGAFAYLAALSLAIANLATMNSAIANLATLTLNLALLSRTTNLAITNRTALLPKLLPQSQPDGPPVPGGVPFPQGFDCDE